MKKILFSILAILLICGIANAANIPTASDAQNAGEKWIMQVYLNSATAVSEGDIVVWDVDSSTGDDYAWVNTSTTANTGPIAGVANNAISAYTVGSIVIYGIKDINVSGATQVATGAGTPYTTSTTAGKARKTTAGDDFIVGHSIAAGSGTTVPCFINPTMADN